MPEKWPYFRTNRKGCRHEGSGFLKIAEEQVWFTGSPAARSVYVINKKNPHFKGRQG